MSSQVEFFCSPREEREILTYLTKDEGTQVFDISDGKMSSWDHFSVDDLPDSFTPVKIYVWQPPHGALKWHTSTPVVEGPTHSSFVMNLFAREEWQRLGLGADDQMLDTDRSPIIQYCRGTKRDGASSQSSILAPPSNLRRAGLKYESFVKRALAWIRRRGTIIHDYRQPSATLSNPHSLLNTIYAFPDALREFEADPHKFAIRLE